MKGVAAGSVKKAKKRCIDLAKKTIGAAHL
jgi:hypothetical protein